MVVPAVVAPVVVGAAAGVVEVENSVSRRGRMYDSWKNEETAGVIIVVAIIVLFWAAMFVKVSG